MDRIRRKPDRARTERDQLNDILDTGQVGVLSTVLDGLPWSVPLLYARVGDNIVLHGSTGAGALRHVAAGANATFCVFHLDGIVVADTLFDSSANYRSAVVRGTLEPLSGAEAVEGLVRMSDGLIPGRSQEVGTPTKKEMAATLAVAMRITEDNWTAKARTGGPGEPADKSVWTGVVGVHPAYDAPEPTEWATDLDVPASVRALLD